MLKTRFVTKIKTKIKNISVLHIGNEAEELLVDDMTCLPILPATSIAGAFRAYLEDCVRDKNALDSLFGYMSGEGVKSRLFISDAYGKRYDLESRTRVCLNKKTGTAENPFTSKYIAENIEFVMEFKIESETKEQLESDINMLGSCLHALNQQYIRFGAHKANGAGKFSIVQNEYETFDLYNQDSLCAYLLNQESYKPFDVTNLGQSIPYLMLEAEVLLHTPLLIAGIDENTAGAANKISIRKKNGAYYIPGSSLKGVLRHHCERIAKYLKLDDSLINALFGTNEGEGLAGSVYFEDMDICDVKDRASYSRIHLDAFTSGVMTGGQFADQPVTGKSIIRLYVRKAEGDTLYKVKMAIILLAFRDLLSGVVSLGSGFNVGRGRLAAQSFTLQENGKCHLLNLQENNKIVNNYMQCLNDHKGGNVK